MRRPAAVGGDDRPLVLEHPSVGRAQRDHRLDCQREALDQPLTTAGTAVVQQVRGLVHGRADAVATVVVDDPVGAVGTAVAADLPLDSVADVGEPAAELRRRQPRPQRGLAHAGELQRLGRHLADRHGDGRIAMPAVEDRSAVDRQQIAVAKYARAGDAMDDLVVHGGADAALKARLAHVTAVIEERRDGALSADRAFRDLVEILRGHPRDNRLAELVQRAGNHQPRLAHQQDL